MNELADQDSGPWSKDTLVNEFDAVWREKAVVEQPLTIIRAATLVAEAMNDLLSRMEKCGNPTRRQLDRLGDLVGAVQTAVIGTLRSASPYAVHAPDRKPQLFEIRWKNLDLGVSFRAPDIAASIRNGLGEVEAAFALKDPAQRHSITESARLMGLLQALLRAEAQRDADMALRATSRIRGFLSSEGVEVVDENRVGDHRSRDYFEFEDEAHRLCGGGEVTLPALVDVGTKRAISQGRVQAGPRGNQAEITGSTMSKEQSR